MSLHSTNHLPLPRHAMWGDEHKLDVHGMRMVVKQGYRQFMAGAHHQMYAGAWLPFLGTPLKGGKRRKEEMRREAKEMLALMHQQSSAANHLPLRKELNATNKWAHESQQLYNSTRNLPDIENSKHSKMANDVASVTQERLKPEDRYFSNCVQLWVELLTYKLLRGYSVHQKVFYSTST